MSSTCSSSYSEFPQVQQAVSVTYQLPIDSVVRVNTLVSKILKEFVRDSHGDFVQKSTRETKPFSGSCRDRRRWSRQSARSVSSEKQSESVPPPTPLRKEAPTFIPSPPTDVKVQEAPVKPTTAPIIEPAIEKKKDSKEVDQYIEIYQPMGTGTSDETFQVVEKRLFEKMTDGFGYKKHGLREFKENYDIFDGFHLEPPEDTYRELLEHRKAYDDPETRLEMIRNSNTDISPPILKSIMTNPDICISFKRILGAFMVKYVQEDYDHYMTNYRPVFRQKVEILELYNAYKDNKAVKYINDRVKMENQF